MLTANKMSFSFQWFPGHIGRARRELKPLVSQAQIVFHILDARAPSAAFYPELIQKRKAVIVFAKTDLADLNLTLRWKEWFENKGYPVYLSRKNDTLQELKKADFWKKSSLFGKAVVTGLPNVGKSTFINCLVGRKKAKTGKIPGITRGPQWIKLDERIYLLDTPGIFYPQNLPEAKVWRLAVLGIIPESRYTELVFEVGNFLIQYVRENYGVFKDQPEDFSSFLEIFGRSQGILSKGGNVHLENAALRLIREFQAGKWGRITLEKPTK